MIIFTTGIQRINKKLLRCNLQTRADQKKRHKIEDYGGKAFCLDIISGRIKKNTQVVFFEYSRRPIQC